MAVAGDRAERILTYITLGQSKDALTPPLSDEESTYWDQVATEVKDGEAKGLTVDLPHEWRG